MAEVRLKALAKRFGELAAVEAVDLSLPDGAFVSVLGPSGCGKTTLLRLIAGLETPSAGTIRIGEEDVTALAPERRGLGMMFQSYALLPHMTVAENLRFPLRMRRIGNRAAQRAKVDAALELVRLSGFGSRYPHELSGGQQQRVALARALIADPPVLLLDEPLSNLDAQLRREMQIELIELHRKLRLTTIMVTHDQEEALSLSDIVVLMYRGRIEQVGAPREIYQRPRTVFAAGFIGGANVLPVALRRKPRGSWTADLGAGARLDLPEGAAGSGAPRNAHLLLRQEDLGLEAVPPTKGLSLPARVVAAAYQGAHSKVTIEVGAGHRLSLLLPVAIGDLWKPGTVGFLIFGTEAVRIIE